MYITVSKLQYISSVSHEGIIQMNQAGLFSIH